MNKSEGIENTQDAAHGPAFVRGLSICRFGVVAKGPEVSPQGALRDYCTPSACVIRWRRGHQPW